MTLIQVGDHGTMGQIAQFENLLFDATIAMFFFLHNVTILSRLTCLAIRWTLLDSGAAYLLWKCSRDWESLMFLAHTVIGRFSDLREW